MNVVSQNKVLYYFLVFISGSLTVIAIGPGLFDLQDISSHWQYIFFEKVCHQDPVRSYSINGLSMAVCARCLGIYSSFFVGVVLMPLNARWVVASRRVNIYLLSTAIGINAFDVLLNALSVYSNSLFSRLVLGAFFGLTLAILINDEFFKINTQSEDKYGREYST